jgi:hypothetical protein
MASFVCKLCGCPEAAHNTADGSCSSIQHPRCKCRATSQSAFIRKRSKRRSPFAELVDDGYAEQEAA